MSTCVAEELHGLAGLATAQRRRSASKLDACRNTTKTPKMPSAKPKSPTRLTMKALIAAALASGFVVPEADQQIGREAHAFPAEEQLQEVVGRHQHQHGEGEQRQIGEEARPVRILVPCSRSNRRARATTRWSPPPASRRSAYRRGCAQATSRSPEVDPAQQRDLRRSVVPERRPAQKTIQDRTARYDQEAGGDELGGPVRR